MANVNPFEVAPENFKTPYGYESYLRAQASAANKRISDMDMFYANLDEATRQFDETLGFKVETRDLELDWQKEQWGEELEFKESSLEANVGLQNRALGIQEGSLGLEREKFAFTKEQYEDKTDQEDEAFDFFKDYMKNQDSGGSSGEGGEKSGYSYSGPWGPEAESFASDFVSDVRGEGVTVDKPSSGTVDTSDWRSQFAGGGSSTDASRFGSENNWDDWENF